MTADARRATPLVPPHLSPGDRIRFVSPSSTPDRDLVARGAEVLTGSGLQVEIGEHAFEPQPATVPLGTTATIDPADGTLTVAAAVG
jgi:muramoyltetrapeptide carboxypeptidase LdcA involved in peptidoglycan recycling